MNDVIPEQGLGPQNQKWRQWVERKITNLQRNMEQKFGADISNSFKSIDSSMGLLSRQVQTLNGFVPVASDFSNTSTVITPAFSGIFTVSTFDPLVDPSVTVEVPSGRLLVSVSGVGSVVTLGGSSVATGEGYGYIVPEVVGVSDLSSPQGVAAGATVNGTARWFAAMGGTFTRVFTVDPGTYEVRARRGSIVTSSSAALTFTSTYRSVSVQTIPAHN